MCRQGGDEYCLDKNSPNQRALAKCQTTEDTGMCEPDNHRYSPDRNNLNRAQSDRDNLNRRQSFKCQNNQSQGAHRYYQCSPERDSLDRTQSLRQQDKRSRGADKHTYDQSSLDQDNLDQISLLPRTSRTLLVSGLDDNQSSPDRDSPDRKRSSKLQTED